MIGTRFSTLAEFRRALEDLPAPSDAAASQARERNERLTKPPAALGRLEELAIWYAGWQTPEPRKPRRPQIVIFAGNHGVTAQGVSAFPAEVTAQMVATFVAGGAAINQLADLAGAKLDVRPLELDRPTADMTQAPAMGEDELCAALSAGWASVDPATDLLVAGEMGIGNTTAAAALAAALFGEEAAAWTGRGTGLDDAALEIKRSVVDSALRRHGRALSDPLEALRRVGGRELAAMAGAILHARSRSIPVILDGFICCAAAAVLDRLRPGALDHAVAGHLSPETGHAAVLARLGKVPLLSLDMRLGEGSGAAVAIHVLRAALACHSGMATFEEAGVSEG